MGGSQSTPQKPPAVDPLINRLRKAFRLTLPEDKKITYSLIHSHFSQAIRSSQSKISIDLSPICSVIIPNHETKAANMVSCTVISPIMLLASSHLLCDEKGFFSNNKLQIKGMVKEKIIVLQISKMDTFKQHSITVITLAKPVWELGWCGLTYLSSPEQINQTAVYSMGNTYELSKEKENPANKPAVSIYTKIQRVFYAPVEDIPFVGRGGKKGHNLVYVIENKKPYVIGVQKEQYCIFLDLQLIKQLQKFALDLLQPQVERSLLKSMDIQKLQIQSMW